jgi:Nucleotidyl transferase AbiEii toxin, Type IV TA system
MGRNIADGNDDDAATQVLRHHQAPAPRNIVASLSQRLLTLAKQRHDEFQLVLTRYALERLLYRIGQSPYKGEFVVKGALLFSIWSATPHRVTRDLDLLGFGPADVARLEQIFRELCHVQVEDDGLRFMEDAVHAEPIRVEVAYGGIRIRLLALLGKARIPLQIDVGFGDVVTPAPTQVTFPTLLDAPYLPAPHVRAYPREAMVAEKFEALVKLGMVNTRMKDFYDLWVLARTFTFSGATISAALQATFDRRGTLFPADAPLALTRLFADNPTKQLQWNVFLRKSATKTDVVSLAEVVTLLSAFLLPPAQALVRGEQFLAEWPAGGPWQ